MSPAGLLPARAWLTVGLLWIVGLLNYLDRVMLTTMRLSIKAAVPMTEAQFGLLTTVFLIVYAVLSPFAGYLADRFNRSRVIIGSLFLWSFFTWLTAHASTYGELLCTRAAMGLSEACYLPAALALIADYHRGPTRSLATGIHLSGVMVGSALGGLGGWLADRHGWAYAFNLFGYVGIGYSCVLLALLRGPADLPPPANTTPSGAPRVSFGEALASLLAQRTFHLLLAFWGLLGVVGWAVTGWMPTYLLEEFHLSQGTAGFYATGFVNCASLVGMLAGGAWADYWSRTQERGRILVPVIGLAVAAPMLLLAVNTPWLALTLAALVGYGLTRAFVDPNMMPILCLVADPRYRATGYGVLNFMACVVGGATIYIGGALRDASIGIRYVFVAAALVAVICATLLSFVRPRPAAPP